MACRNRQVEPNAWVANSDAVHSQLALCQLPGLGSRSEEKKLTGWKQGHTPAVFSKPLPLAGVSFWEIALDSCEFQALGKEQTTRRTRGKVHKPRRIDNNENWIYRHNNQKTLNSEA